MPNQETSVDQYRNGTGSAATANTATTTSHRKASFIDNLTPNVQSVSRKNSAHSATPPKPVKEEVLYSSKSLKLSEYTFSDCHGNQKSAEVIHKHFDPNCLPQTYGTETTTLTAKNTSLPSALADSAYDHPDQGILSIAILKRHILCDCLILVKKYRPTLKSFVLEFPAKIVEHNNLASGPQSSAASTDGNESDTSVGDAAVKDVEENTGYKSTQVKWVSPDTAVDPELCDNKLKLVSLIIDGDDPIKNDLLNQCSSGAASSCSDDDDSGINKHECTNECLDDIEVIPVPINGLLDRLNEYSRRNVVVDSRVYAFAIGLKKGEKMAAQALKGEQVEMHQY